MLFDLIAHQLMPVIVINRRNKKKSPNKDERKKWKPTNQSVSRIEHIESTIKKIIKLLPTKRLKGICTSSLGCKKAVISLLLYAYHREKKQVAGGPAPVNVDEGLFQSKESTIHQCPFDHSWAPIN